MQTGHARPTTVPAPRIQRTPGLTRHERGKKPIQGCLEHRLEPPQDELPSPCRVDDRAEVMGYQIFGKRIALDPRERRQGSDQSVSIRVQHI